MGGYAFDVTNHTKPRIWPRRVDRLTPSQITVLACMISQDKGLERFCHSLAKKRSGTRVKRMVLPRLSFAFKLYGFARSASLDSDKACLSASSSSTLLRMRSALCWCMFFGGTSHSTFTSLPSLMSVSQTLHDTFALLLGLVHKLPFLICGVLVP